MPTKAQYDALMKRYQEEHTRAETYLQAGRTAGQEFQAKIDGLERRVADLTGHIESLKIDALDRPNHDEVALVVMRSNLPGLKQALVRQQVYCDRQAEGYAKILATIPNGNETLKAYYLAYQEEAAACEDLMIQIDRAINDGHDV